MGDIGLVREALRERELLLTRIAPHLVEPVPFLWPLRGRGWERAYLGAGLVLYDSIGGARSVPRHRHLSRRGALAAAPALREDALVGAVQFHDALEDDARMVAVVARTAAAHGAAHRHARAGHRLPRPRRGRGGRRGDGRDARAARPPRRERRRRVDRPPARARRRALGVAQRPLQGHPRLRAARAHPDGHRRARPHREERPVRDPVAGRLADRRHRHAVERRRRPAGRHRRRRRLPARQGQRAARRAAAPRRRPRRDRRAAAARRRGGALATRRGSAASTWSSRRRPA